MKEFIFTATILSNMGLGIYYIATGNMLGLLLLLNAFVIFTTLLSKVQIIEKRKSSFDLGPPPSCKPPPPPPPRPRPNKPTPKPKKDGPFKLDGAL